MSADLLLQRLKGVKRTGPGRWQARCPAHADRGPSLSVREADSGLVLVHCFAGCSVESITAAAGIALEDLFPPKPSRPGGGRPSEPRPFSVRQLVEAFAHELRVVYVILADAGAGKVLSERDQARALKARERIAALAEELRNVR